EQKPRLARSVLQARACRHSGCEHALSLCRLGLAASRAGHAGIRDAAIAGVGTGIFEVARSGLQYLSRLFRDCLPSDGIPDLEVDFPAANSGRATGDRGVRLRDQQLLDLSRADTGASSLSLALAAGVPSRTGPCAVASHQRCQYLEMGFYASPSHGKALP